MQRQRQARVQLLGRCRNCCGVEQRLSLRGGGARVVVSGRGWCVGGGGWGAGGVGADLRRGSCVAAQLVAKWLVQKGVWLWVLSPQPMPRAATDLCAFVPVLAVDPPRDALEGQEG